MRQLPGHADKPETSKIKKVNLIILAYAKLDYMYYGRPNNL